MDALSVCVGGVTLRNPVVLAAGTCGYSDELADAFDLGQVGAVTGKSITREPREGNPHPRIVDAEAGMLNAIGLANLGLDRFLAEVLPRAGRLDCAYFASVAGHSMEDYLAVATAFAARREISLVEVNVSCPNTATGRAFGDDPEALRGLVRRLRAALGVKPMSVKLSPAAPDIVGVAAIALEEGANALTLVNTLPTSTLDPATGRGRLSLPQGGLSGPAIHALALRIVREVHERVAARAGVPIIGTGGIMRWEDAAEMILAGATAVGMGTALFAAPRSPLAVARGLADWVARQGCASVTELVGTGRA